MMRLLFKVTGGSRTPKPQPIHVPGHPCAPRKGSVSDGYGVATPNATELYGNVDLRTRRWTDAGTPFEATMVAWTLSRDDHWRSPRGRRRCWPPSGST